MSYRRKIKERLAEVLVLILLYAINFVAGGHGGAPLVFFLVLEVPEHLLAGQIAAWVGIVVCLSAAWVASDLVYLCAVLVGVLLLSFSVFCFAFAGEAPLFTLGIAAVFFWREAVIRLVKRGRTWWRSQQVEGEM